MASRSMHNNLLNNVMRSPMAFFDTNPSGRIVNRFTSDMDSMDQSIPFSLLDFSECTVDFTCVIILISVTTPAFVAVIIPLLIFYYFLPKKSLCKSLSWILFPLSSFLLLPTQLMDFIKPGIVDWKRVKKEDQMSKMAAKRLQEVSFSMFLIEVLMLSTFVQLGAG